MCFGWYIPTFRMYLIVNLFGFICVLHANVTVSSKVLLYQFRFLKYLAAGNVALPDCGKIMFKFV